ncbi:MAG: hypothetical protein IPJ84_07545 [Bdellovibrionales bacterium]|nr:hypothetical protein [Bdellovibrionales bacterium]
MCGEQFSTVKEWDLKILRAPPLGVFQHVTDKFMQLRGTATIVTAQLSPMSTGSIQSSAQ